MQALIEIEEYLEPLVDVEDGDNGWPKPNKEMRLLSTVHEAMDDMNVAFQQNKTNQP